MVTDLHHSYLFTLSGKVYYGEMDGPSSFTLLEKAHPITAIINYDGCDVIVCNGEVLNNQGYPYIPKPIVW